MTDPTYKRPTVPNLETQRASTAKLREQLDRHAAHEGIRLHRPVSARELAGTIRKSNDSRAARVESVEQEEAARLELLEHSRRLEQRLEAMTARTPLDDALLMYVAGVSEFLQAMDRQGADRRDAFTMLRETRAQLGEAIHSMDRARGAR
jgi:hypothetical protein